jgi:hypothetical protein
VEDPKPHSEGETGQAVVRAEVDLIWWMKLSYFSTHFLAQFVHIFVLLHLQSIL